MLGPPKSLRQAVRNHLVCWLVLEINDAILNLFEKKVELDVNVLCSCIENWILWNKKNYLFNDSMII